MASNIVVVNRRKHKVTIGLYNDHGVLVERNLRPLDRTEPIPEAKIAPYTKQLCASKHVDLITVPA